MNGAAPVVSVVMPTLNAAGYLAAALAGLRAQTLREFECVIVDDGSTDGTREVVERTARGDGRFRLIAPPARLGLARSLNVGLEAARGEFIARYDADDVSLPQRLARQVAHLRAHAETCLVAAGCEIIGPDGTVMVSNPLRADRRRLRRLLRGKPAFPHGAVMYRRAEVLALGGYRPLFAAAEDFDLWLRISERYEIDAMPEVLYRYRFHPEGAFSRRYVLSQRYARLARRFAWERRRSGRDSYDLYERGERTLPAAAGRGAGLAGFHLENGLIWFQANRLVEARREFVASLREAPVSLRAWFWLAMTFLGAPVLDGLRRVKALFC